MEPNAAAINQAAVLLRGGGLVAFPTETVYGLGADASDAAAVGRVFAVKGRPPTHPLIVHLAAGLPLDDWAVDVPDTAHRLAAELWPGPLTLVLRRGPRVALATTGGSATVAVRVPDHPVAQAILAAFGGGVAAPSANRFGSVSPTTAEHVRRELGAAVDLVVDGGPCAVGVESTIVDVAGDQPTILRPGGVTREQLEAVLGSVVAVPSTSPIAVPGQHPSHYAPRARVVLVPVGGLPAAVVAARDRGLRVGVLVPPGLADEMSAEVVTLVPADAEDYARGLYGFLRDFDEQGCDLVVASLPERAGLGLAIANRLQRAAGPRLG